MSENDPHIHVEKRVVEAGSGVRNVLASAFGLVGDPPTVVTTGCGQQVPYAMTSPRPESVTCLPCREHGHREHLRFAEQVENLSQQAIGLPGVNVTVDDATKVAAWHRDRATRFTG